MPRIPPAGRAIAPGGPLRGRVAPWGDVPDRLPRLLQAWAREPARSLESLADELRAAAATVARSLNPLAPFWGNLEAPQVTQASVRHRHLSLSGWLAHESCDVSGELWIAMAGRLARAYFVETPGVFRQHWTMEDVAREAPNARAAAPEDLWDLGVMNGFEDHILKSFDMNPKRGAPA